MKITARKPRNPDQDHAVLDISDRNEYTPFVACTIAKGAELPQIEDKGWLWGHYFKTEGEALDYFASCASRR